MHIITGLLISMLLGKKNLAGGIKEGKQKPIGFRNIIEVLHYLPGRVRYNIPSLQQADFGKSSLEAVKNIKGIETVTANKLTGSVLVCYDETILSPDIITAALIHTFGLQEAVEKPPVPEIWKTLNGATESLNRAVYEKSGGLVDLWTGIPLGLAAVAIFRMLSQRTLTLPGSFTLLWWAYMALAQSNRKD